MHSPALDPDSGPRLWIFSPKTVTILWRDVLMGQTAGYGHATRCQVFKGRNYFIITANHSTFQCWKIFLHIF